MVRIFLPQKFVGNKTTNTNHPPQGITITGQIEGGWIDDLGNQFIDNFGTSIIFEEVP